MFKDEYLLDYINVEQLGERDEDIDERVIEKEIVNNVKNFIMTFGKGFTFSGSCRIIFTSLTTMTAWSGRIRRWALSSVRMPTKPSLNTCCRITTARWGLLHTRPIRRN